MPPTEAGRVGKRVGIIELLAYTVSSEWLSLPLVKDLKRQYYSIMPQVVSVWCRQLGHNVTYATCYGQADPLSLLPDDLDVVFIVASTQACALAYALAKVYRRRGVMTVIGGPHAKCFPHDCARFFDVTVTRCDQQLLRDILDGHIDRPAIAASTRSVDNFPSVEERLPELRIAAFGGNRPMRTSVISLFSSVGCPYDCDFCTDWNSTFTPIARDLLREDLQFVARKFPGTLLGFHDPNFGVRFDETLALFDETGKPPRNPYVMQCSMSILNEARVRRLADTGCLYIAPGIESWSEYGKKMRMTKEHGQDRVTGISEQFAMLGRHVPGLQANFVMGLDVDSGWAPFALTAAFAQRVPQVWPNINIITPYGGTPVHDDLARRGRLLRGMPLALYCSPYLPLILRNYDPVEFYDHLITLLGTLTSGATTAKRVMARGHIALKLARIAQTLAVRRDIQEMRAIVRELRRDHGLRAFHAGRDVGLPRFYSRHLDQRLGRYAELLTSADRMPILQGAV